MASTSRSEAMFDNLALLAKRRVEKRGLKSWARYTSQHLTCRSTKPRMLERAEGARRLSQRNECLETMKVLLHAEEPCLDRQPCFFGFQIVLTEPRRAVLPHVPKCGGRIRKLPSRDHGRSEERRVGKE